MRDLAIGIGAVIMTAGMSGCYINTSHRTISGPETSIPPAIPAAAAAVSVDGWPRELRGDVACTRNAESLKIAAGTPDNVVAVSISSDSSKVDAVQLREVPGVLMGYRDGGPGAQASAAREGAT